MSFLGETMTLRVVELFAGVGGFRIGFESLNNKKKSNLFEVSYDMFRKIVGALWEHFR